LPPPGPVFPKEQVPPVEQRSVVVVKLADVTEVNDVDVKVNV
jgi:hypothetical protein